MSMRREKIDTPERWFMDNYRIWAAAGFFVTLDVDMSVVKHLIARMRQDGFHGTYTHVLVRAVALGLKRDPELHIMMTEGSRFYPERIDVCIPVGAEGFVPPVVILEDAGNKLLRPLAEELMCRAHEARTHEPADFNLLRRWGGWVPGWLRRGILRRLWRQASFRRQKAGTFQVSCLNAVDSFVPILFPGTAMIATGRVKDQVVAVDGRVEIRPMITLACAADHKAWDGLRAQRLLQKIAQILTGRDLDAEWSESLSRRSLKIRP